jgi:DNA invertase Pin-like site-specific DNA recombinase
MRVATYLRVSTKGQDLEPQRRRLAELAEARGWEIEAEFSDVASGRRARRPGLAALVRAARRHQFDAVLCVRIDRLARSTAHLCQLAEELEVAEVDLVVADQPVDTTTAAGRLLFGVLSCIAAFEADLIRERTRDGLAVARAKGKRLGRPPKLDERRKVARARRLVANGQSLREAAAVLECSPMTVLRAVRGRR